MKLLIHCCCAPCSIACVNSLRTENIEPCLLWYNPNIHPYTEYKKRHESFSLFINEENIESLNIDEYGLQLFLKEVLPNKEKRCETCYRIRLEKTASIAIQKGFDAFTTTLLISPYQDHETIKRIGEETAIKYNINFLYKDFRPLFRESQTAALAKNYYKQKYCGCIFSEEERFGLVTSDECLVTSEKNQTQIQHSTLDTTHSTLHTKHSTLHTKHSTLHTKHSTLNTKHSTLHTKHSSLDIKKNLFERLGLLIGEEGINKLKNTHVLVFGVGGVGSWAAEALVRSGIGKIGIIDNDVICASNINRQIEATTLTIGLPKAATLKKRLLEINPECEVTAWDELFCRENADKFNIEKADYVIDAIDSLNHKLDLIEIVYNSGVVLFSSMGMALKMDPSRIKTASIWKTDNCPLARHVRQGLRKRGFSGDFTVVYSNEQPIKTSEQPAPGQKPVNGSAVTVTASAGLMLASLVLQCVVTND
ncbi:MAG: epoxyqueuosine reductase QueH [Treponema sp.]|nr:epoxyqueuosine reductase QueH [Treponema sp.]